MFTFNQLRNLLHEFKEALFDAKSILHLINTILKNGLQVL